MFTIVVVLFVGLYLSTMARYGVGFGDSDELIGVGYGLGVLHPPGYPVLNFLIYGITHLVPYGTIPFRAHLLAVGFQSLTLGIVFLLGNELLYQARKKRDSIGVWLPLVGVVGLGFAQLKLRQRECLRMVFVLSRIGIESCWRIGLCVRQCVRHVGF